jgi:hypothetical protein
VTPAYLELKSAVVCPPTAVPPNRTSCMLGKTMDAALLVWGLQAGAAIVGTEVVKEVTKDCYRALKGTIAEVFGKRAARTIDDLEASPANTEAAGELKAIVGSISAEDGNEIGPKLQALLEALRADDAAKEIIESVAKIKLEVDAKGHIVLDTIQGAREIDIKANAGKDFVMKNVTMDSGPKTGK